MFHVEQLEVMMKSRELVIKGSELVIKGSELTMKGRNCLPRRRPEQRARSDEDGTMKGSA